MNPEKGLPTLGDNLGDYKDPRDKDRDGITDEAERLPQVKYDTVREAFRSKDGFWKGSLEVIRNTAAGRNTVGMVAGIGLDVLEIVAPIPIVSKVREAGKKALNLNKDRNDMKDALKGIISKEAWKRVLTFKDKEGNWSFQEALTTIAQMAAVVGVLWLADYLGVLEPLLKIFGVLFGIDAGAL